MSGWGNRREPDLSITVARGRGGGRTAEVDLDRPLWSGDRHVPAPAEPQRPAPAPAEPEKPARRRRPQRLLRPEDYLTEPVEPPTMGWRRAAWRCGMRRIQPGGRELRHRGWTRRIRRSLRSPKVVAVFSPKGGVGKSTTALQVGEVLARLRGDLVAALDANPDSGNLVKRVREPYSVSTAGELHDDRAGIERYADLMPYVTQADSGLCVVRSDPGAAARLGPGEYREILSLLTRFYAIVIVDLGTGMREPAFQAIIEAADSVVAVARPTFDSAEVLAEGIEWLAGRFGDKITEATMVLNSVDPGPGQLDTDRLREDFADRVGRVLTVPHDRHLAAGGVPQWPLLTRDTQDAYLRLAANVVDSLPG